MLREPIIETRKGKRKPDLVIVDATDCRIIDVTITVDVFNMSVPYQQKITYYAEEEILH